MTNLGGGKVVYSSDVQLMVKGSDKLGYGLVRLGCAPPKLTFTVAYVMGSQVSAAFLKALSGSPLGSSLACLYSGLMPHPRVGAKQDRARVLRRIRRSVRGYVQHVQ
jgi:hypothetical protein